MGEHGFVVRGDFENDSAVREAADKVMLEANTLFTACCIRDSTYTKVGSLTTFSKGISCIVKVLSDTTEAVNPQRTEDQPQFYEVTIGDETGQFILSLRETQRQEFAIEQIICVRKASVKMIRGFMRLCIDAKSGSIDTEVQRPISTIGPLNLSKIEHELVT